VTQVLIALAPLIAAVLSLVFGWYPGEELLLRLAGASPHEAPERPASSPHPGRGHRRDRIPRGPALIGSGLAGRAPPLMPNPRFANASASAGADERI
jgi:hypothetical protein